VVTYGADVYDSGKIFRHFFNGGHDMTGRMLERAVVREIPRLFGIRIEEDEYEPYFSCDDVVYVDSGIIPKPDEICFVIIGHEAFFRFFDGNDGRETRFTRLNDLSRQDVIGNQSPSQPIIMRVMGVRRGLRLYTLEQNSAFNSYARKVNNFGLLLANSGSC
jgi:hypothetical protein